ncbi:NYN domain-containing protein [Sediminihabitans luteus]|uniref:NYN domain-containing protein n=1 Tax=Sediminihabitans luteus TaxID=1138585 RepID=UPI0012FD9FFC|nr:NYN domain-containing protein [Sediminihabitans luteus]GII99714.1 NYN domain-containing protein [Sediminihabitans luteus]
MTTTTAGPTESTRNLRAAMFVDFDNVYIGLRRLDPAAAEAFATDPGHWLAELETGTDADGDFTRRFLVRSCYLNPSVFSQFRPNFTRAGFQVVDCPSLTQQGKSSADINLVLDAVDALAADTRYEEFVIVSADADFTPLLQRCRADDRRVTIITASPAASAYRAVADTVITADDLAELVTGTAGVLDDAPVAQPAPARTSRGRSGGSRGRGQGQGHAKAEPPAATSAAETTPAGTEAPAPAPAADDFELLPFSPARAVVLKRVRAADRPLTLGAVAQVAQKADPALAGSDWAGTGGFAAWLAHEVPEVGVSSRPPGHVWDPARFGEADIPGATTDTDPSALQRQVTAVTDVPGLSPQNYRALLTALADDVAAHPFDRAATSRRVRDACQEAGAPVGRSTVNFVISGVLYADVTLGDGPSAAELAAAYADHVVGLCRGARMDLSPGDVAALRAWVGGGLLDD